MKKDIKTGYQMVQQMGYQTGYQTYTLNNVYTTMYLNNVLKQCIETMLKDNSIFSNMQILFLSFFSRVKKATQVAPMLTNKNMDSPCTYEGREK